MSDNIHLTNFIYTLQVRKLGPGSYNIKDFLESSDEKPRSKLGICQTLAQRFREKTVVCMTINDMDSMFNHNLSPKIEFIL